MTLFQDHGDEVQCVAWQPTGKLAATQCKDRKLRVVDPRSGKVAAEADSHEGMKDSKVVWVGDSQRLLTTGFSSVRILTIDDKLVSIFRQAIVQTTSTEPNKTSFWTIT